MTATAWRVKPVNIRFHSPALSTDVRKGVGYRVTCACGYQGSTRSSFRKARDDGKLHAETHDPRFAEGCELTERGESHGP